MSQPYWRHIFAWRDHIFGLVVDEFVASLEITGRVKDLTSSIIKFRVFNTTHHISVDTLDHLLGFYTHEEKEDEWYWITISRPGLDGKGQECMVCKLLEMI